MANSLMFERSGPSGSVSKKYANNPLNEDEILELGERYKKEGKASDLAKLIKEKRPFLSGISKAKAAKLVRSLVDFFLDLDVKPEVKVNLCKECIDWAKGEKRIFLRQSLEARLVALQSDSGRHHEALALAAVLLKELKKLDDKNLLIEVLILESKSFHAVGNLSKARTSLTSARTTANSTYCNPQMQASLDLQTGILYAADERDFKTAYSYFYEAFDSYHSIDNPGALTALKYMLLSKIMLNTPEDVQHLLGGKLAVKYIVRDIEAMKSVAQASKKRSLADFQTALLNYKKELEEDPIVRGHLATLYDTMLEQNLCRIIEPYSRVQVNFVAAKIGLHVHHVENKLSQMILDKKLHGILDHADGVLIVFDDVPVDKMYQHGLETINSMGKVVDTLYHKAKKLT